MEAVVPSDCFLLERARVTKSGDSTVQAIRGTGPGLPRTPVWIFAATPIVMWMLLLYMGPTRSPGFLIVSFVALALAPVPVLVIAGRRQARLSLEAARASEETEKLKRELETVRYRTARLAEELAAADSEARQSRQLTLLGRFTAGFLHEFNNPLAILTSRIEVLLEERKQDRDLCSDLNQMLKEARYMANISGTLLPALRRERGAQTFSPCAPADVLQEIVASLGSLAEKRGVQLVLEPAEVSPVNLPEHVLAECLRALVANALDALHEQSDATVWMRIETYHSPGSRVVLRVEDNGPGVPDELREHLFEPFTSSSVGRERLGLGLFVAASLLDTYDGSLSYEPRPGGGARFTLELPPSRFTKEEPYHWFVQEASA
jgi:two-component system C4-dicarboxylate transport sensor histidine kinase DctB